MQCSYCIGRVTLHFRHADRNWRQPHRRMDSSSTTQSLNRICHGRSSATSRNHEEMIEKALLCGKEMHSPWCLSCTPCSAMIKWDRRSGRKPSTTDWTVSSTARFRSDSIGRKRPVAACSPSSFPGLGKAKHLNNRCHRQRQQRQIRRTFLCRATGDDLDSISERLLRGTAQHQQSTSETRSHSPQRTPRAPAAPAARLEPYARTGRVARPAHLDPTGTCPSHSRTRDATARCYRGHS